MSDRSVWYHFAGQIGPTQKRSILDSLASVGVVTHALDCSNPSGSGVFFFDQVTEQLCEFLRDASHGGQERILCIALSKSMLVSRGAWQLRKAGASDIFAWDDPTEAARQASARFERWTHVDDIIMSPLVKKNLAGQSRAWIRALRQAVEIAQFT